MGSDDQVGLQDRPTVSFRRERNDLANAATILSDLQAEACLRLARQFLMEPTQATDAPDIPDIQFEMINLTIYSGGDLRASVSGRGSTLAYAIKDAARRALEDTRFGPVIQPHDIAKGRLELWIQHTATPIARPQDIDLGLDGVAFKLGSRQAYYKPSVALTRAVTGHERLLGKLAKKAGLPPESWRIADAQILRTHWEHYAERPADRPRAIRLRRLRPVEIPSITRAEVFDAARLAAQRLLVVQQADGHYTYKDHPFRRKTADGPGSTVRQAGCAYAMARYAEATADPVMANACAASAGRAVAFLMTSAVVRPAGGLYLVETETGQSKLGTNALTLAALQCRSLAGFRSNEREQLGAGIVASQRADGSFCCVNQNGSAEVDGRKQDFYPGQALLALCRELHEATDRRQQTIEAAFPWYRDYFRRNPTTAFVPWQADAWRLFALWCSKTARTSARSPDEYASFVFETVDWLLQFQNDEGTHPSDLTGGFAISGNEPGFSTATFSEAVIRAFGLATRLGETERMIKYRRSAKLALGFVFRLRISSATAFLFKNPAGVIGATTKSLRDMTLRCDFDQHTITTLLAALETPGLLDDEDKTAG